MMFLDSVISILFVVSGASPDLAAAVGSRAPNVEPAHKMAFATIGKRNYLPMYLRRISPSAVSAGGRVYCAFQNSKGRPVVMAYDVVAQAWSGPVTASQLGLGRDMHGSPSLYIDRQNHLHLFYGCHTGPLRHARTLRPEDITKWKTMPAPAPRATYPQALRLADGKLCLFYRAGGHPEPWTVRTSDDDGLSWSAPQRILEMRLDPEHARAAAYAHFFPGRDGTTIHCFFSYKEDDRRRWPPKYLGLAKAVYRFNIYYVRRDAGGVWRNAGGDAVALPVSKAQADAKCKVHDSGDMFAYPGAYATDRADNPYLVFRTGVLDWNKGGPYAAFRAGVRELNTDGTAIEPIKEHFATLRDGAWHVTDGLPRNWPADVAAIVQRTAEVAYRQSASNGFGIGYENPYFIFFGLKPKPTAIFLYSPVRGYAGRVGGPAELP